MTVRMSGPAMQPARLPAAHPSMQQRAPRAVRRMRGVPARPMRRVCGCCARAAMRAGVHAGQEGGAVHGLGAQPRWVAVEVVAGAWGATAAGWAAGVAVVGAEGWVF